MTNEQPEQWAVELWRKAVFDYGGASIEDTPAEWRAVITIQRAFAEREAELVARDRRTMEDHGRMLWRDDVEGICASPDMCFEYGDAVRCSPCAIKQSAAAGVQVREPDRTYAPQECRLKRENAELVGRLRQLSIVLTDHVGGGSEWFSALGDDFFVDPKAIRAELQRRKTDAQITKRALVRANSAALKSREADRG